MSIVLHTPKTWGITFEEYNKLGFGSALGGFKVPHSVIKRFRKTIWRNIKDKDIISDTKPQNVNEYKEEEVFDVIGAFNELAFTYVTAIVSSYEILRKTPFEFFEGEMLLDKNFNVVAQPIEGSTQWWIRKAVFNAIEFSVLNRQVWERINKSNVSIGGSSVSQDETSWLLSTDMLGMKAMNCLTNSQLQDYEWIDEKQLFSQTKNGNTKVLKIANLKEHDWLAVE